MNSTDIIQATLDNGNVLPLRGYIAKASGNTCFGILDTKANGDRYFSKYGVNVSQAVVGDHSKVTSVTLLDQTFPVTSAMEAKKDKKQNPIAGSERLVLRSSGQVRINGSEKEFSLRISVLGEDKFNVSGSINGKRGGSGRAVVDAL